MSLKHKVEQLIRSELVERFLNNKVNIYHDTVLIEQNGKYDVLGADVNFYDEDIVHEDGESYTIPTYTLKLYVEYKTKNNKVKSEWNFIKIY